jgi:uncharacterized protein (TIGR00251 family)
MSQGDSHFRHAKTGSAITVKVVPKASKTEIVEILNDGTVKINLKTPRADGTANEVLLRYLAEILNTIPAKLEIVAGSAGIDKLIAILDLDSPTVQERIMRVYTIK